MSILTTPIRINQMELKNRLVMPPMATSKAAEAGEVTPQILAYYREKSAGGYIGLIITEHAYVSPEGKAGKGQMSISSDDDVAGLAQLVNVIHQNGTKVMAQISHAGAAAKEAITGTPALGPSATPMPRSDLLPQEMTEDDIAKVIRDFSAAAIRAQKAGFDGIEIHSAHAYLLNQFYSPLTNKRTDQYTGSTLDGRLKLHLEIIDAVRSVVGPEYPIALRLGACDYTEGGSTLEDSVAAAKILERAGINMLDISGGFCGYIRPGAKEQGYFGELTRAIKQEVHIPVILTGGIVDADAAESLLERDLADLIGVGRAILKDSLWAQKAVLSAAGGQNN